MHVYVMCVRTTCLTIHKWYLYYLEPVLSHSGAITSHYETLRAIMSHPPQDCPNGKMAQYGPIWSNMVIRKHMCIFVY
jgi:hypothetical protein